MTPESDQVLCSRCREVANPTDGWEHNWPNFGKIDLGVDSCSFVALGYRDTWNLEDHLAMTRFGAQHVTFEWGQGWEYDSQGRYRLCRDCQHKLLALVGDFFGPELGESDG